MGAETQLVGEALKEGAFVVVIFVILRAEYLIVVSCLLNHPHTSEHKHIEKVLLEEKISHVYTNTWSGQSTNTEYQGVDCNDYVDR